MAKEGSFEKTFDAFKSFVLFQTKNEEKARRLLKQVLRSIRDERDLKRVQFVVNFCEVKARYNGTFAGMLEPL